MKKNVLYVSDMLFESEGMNRDIKKGLKDCNIIDIASDEKLFEFVLGTEYYDCVIYDNTVREKLYVGRLIKVEDAFEDQMQSILGPETIAFLKGYPLEDQHEKLLPTWSDWEKIVKKTDLYKEWKKISPKNNGECPYIKLWDIMEKEMPVFILNCPESTKERLCSEEWGKQLWAYYETMKMIGVINDYGDAKHIIEMLGNKDSFFNYLPPRTLDY